MPTAESKPLQMVVPALIPCSVLEGHLSRREPWRPKRAHHLLSKSTMCQDSYLTQWSSRLRTPSNALNQLRTCPRPDWGPAAPSRPDVIEAVPAIGAEGLARAEMPAAESTPLQMAVRALTQYSELEGRRFDLVALEAEQAQAPAVEVMDVREQQPNSVEQPASPPSNTLSHLKTCPRPDCGACCTLRA